MSGKRNLLLLALGGVAGYVVGRHPDGVSDTVRSAADLARQRTGRMTGSTFGRSGGHRAAEHASEGGAGIVGSASTADVARPHP